MKGYPGSWLLPKPEEYNFTKFSHSSWPHKASPQWLSSYRHIDPMSMTQHHSSSYGKTPTGHSDHLFSCVSCLYPEIEISVLPSVCHRLIEFSPSTVAEAGPSSMAPRTMPNLQKNNYKKPWRHQNWDPTMHKKSSMLSMFSWWLWGLDYQLTPYYYIVLYFYMPDYSPRDDTSFSRWSWWYHVNPLMMQLPTQRGIW